VDLIHPSTAEEAAASLAEASAHGRRVLIVGGRMHLDRGNPAVVDAELSTTLLAGVVRYDPAEMIAVVRAGTRIGELQRELADGGQEWPVDAPPAATVGGVIAAGVSSPRRLRVGHVRDSVVEMELATGDGRLVRSGAPTVKSVAGYDVHRLLTGSLGTLGCITRVALKVRPLPAARRTLVVAGGGLALGERIVSAVPQAAAVLTDPDRVLVRLEGWTGEVQELTSAVRRIAGAETWDGGFPPPWPDGETVAEVAVAPSRLAAALDRQTRWQALAGVGLAWVGVDGPDHLATLRRRVAEAAGIAPAVRGPGGLGDPPLPARDVHRRLKEAFDPAGVLAPGRFWGGL
jgi:glycolate oxidase FAD binding subunit